MLQKTSHFMREANLIGGEWVQADSGATIDVINPATGLKIGTVPKSGKAETRRAIEAADAAFQTLAARPRCSTARKLLRKLHDAIMDNQQPLAELLTTEQGKSLAESQGRGRRSRPPMCCGSPRKARRTYGDVVPSPWADRRILVTKEPVGVVAAITPWNFPSSMLARKIGAGAGRRLHGGGQAGLADAVFGPRLGRAVRGGRLPEGRGQHRHRLGRRDRRRDLRQSAGQEDHLHRLDRGRQDADGRNARRRVKKVSMELGGNAPFIVFDDADIDRAVEGAMVAKYRNSGQTCVCTNRFFVQAGIYDEFVEKLAAATSKLKVGPGLEDGTQQGPLIDEKAVEKVEELIADAKAKGGKVVTGGKRHALGGSFFEPTVISDAKPDMRFMKEEIFGPVAPVFRFETEEEAVRLANDTEFGLACYFYTGDLGRAFRVMEGAEIRHGRRQ